MDKKIAVILPRIEGFSEADFGAITLCIKDNYLFSQYKSNITIFGGKTKQEESYQGVNYRYIPTERLRHLCLSKNKAFAKELINILKKEKFDLVEVHNRSKVAKYLSKHLSIPICQHLHNDINDDAKSQDNLEFRRNVLSFSEHIYCVSDYVRQRLLEGLPEFQDKASIVYNGLDIEAFSNDSQAIKTNKIIFVGRITKEKGALESLHAINQLFDQLNDWEAVFIGGFSKKYYAYIEEFKAGLNKHPKRVRHYTHMEFNDVMKQMFSSKIAVLPSQWEEPFGRTVLEAIIAKLAIVTCKSGGIPEISGANALYAKKQNIESLIENIRHFIDDQELRCKYSAKALKESKKKFNIRVTTKKLDDIRRDILNDAKENI
ncbi:MAG: glycosyltransferase family 4 protein [Rickettsiales bacterium]|jgi:glycosyltransferase involved in cell wall biosynthesis|nr:glycosyltransferase family 4 protein [Rickettsiales bacterium]